jgi:DNA-binding MurR/RpiR family transcriptional regulator
MTAQSQNRPEAKAAPLTYADLRARIFERHVGLSRQLQKVARFAIDNPDIVALESVYSVSRSAEVQPSAIVRFAQAFGLDGFSSLQRLFRQNLMAGNSDYHERVRTLRQTRGDGSTRLLDDFVRTAISSLEAMQVETPQAQIDAAVELLANADEIFVLGQRRSFAVAHYLNYALSRFGFRNTLVTGTGGMIDFQLARCRPATDVLIAVSFAPYSEAVIERIRTQAGAGIRVVAITDSPLSPVAAHSAIHFKVTGGDHAFRSLVAPICLAQTLVVALGERAGRSSQ